MKDIFLFGDSIRQGYDLYVKESMVNLANVYYSQYNSRDTSFVLRELHHWKSTLKIDNCDAVHFNAGLWDTLRIYNDEPTIKPDVYADNMKRIIERMIFLFPKAKIIFATSTPVDESGYYRDYEFRYNRDIEAYNEIAIKVLKPYNVIINDLYALLKARPELHSDMTHYYTADGTELIGSQVNRVLCEALEMDKSKLVLPDKTKFGQTTLKNDKDLYVKKGDYYELIEGL